MTVADALTLVGDEGISVTRSPPPVRSLERKVCS